MSRLSIYYGPGIYAFIYNIRENRPDSFWERVEDAPIVPLAFPLFILVVGALLLAVAWLATLSDNDKRPKQTGPAGTDATVYKRLAIPERVRHEV